jgi:hypothetical protein
VNDNLHVFGHSRVRCRIAKFADDGAHAAPLEIFGLRRLADERSDLVSRAQKCVKHSGADIPGRASDKDVHGRAPILSRIANREF